MASTTPCCDFILFGTLGDLARRKLLPALYQLEKAELLHAETRILGVARDEIDADTFVQKVRQSLEKFVGSDNIDPPVWERFAARFDYCDVDLADVNAFATLAKQLSADPERS